MRRKFPDASSYKTYDPEREGYGSDGQWRAAFRARMGVKEAREVFSGRAYGPWKVLGVAEGSPWNVVKSAFRRLSMACHPDRAILNGMDKDAATERFKELTAAFTIIDDDYERSGRKN
jgi:DnaJ-class molecular chaperone